MLRRLIQELQELQSEEGAEMVVDGEVVRIHGVFIRFCGDSEAVHEILGLLAGGANVFYNQNRTS